MIYLIVKFHKNGGNGWEIGDSSFMNSFFNTIAYHLESNKWGTKFPIIMNEFYQGSLSPENIDKALEELIEIRKKLSKLPPSAIVWDINDLNVQPPWGSDIADDITNMSNYFRTSDGAEDLFEIIQKAFKDGKNHKTAVIIEDI